MPRSATQGADGSQLIRRGTGVQGHRCRDVLRGFPGTEGTGNRKINSENAQPRRRPGKTGRRRAATGTGTRDSRCLGRDRRRVSRPRLPSPGLHTWGSPQRGRSTRQGHRTDSGIGRNRAQHNAGGGHVPSRGALQGSVPVLGNSLVPFGDDGACGRIGAAVGKVSGVGRIGIHRNGRQLRNGGQFGNGNGQRSGACDQVSDGLQNRFKNRNGTGNRRNNNVHH